MEAFRVSSVQRVLDQHRDGEEQHEHREEHGMNHQANVGDGFVVVFADDPTDSGDEPALGYSEAKTVNEAVL